MQPFHGKIVETPSPPHYSLQSCCSFECAYSCDCTIQHRTFLIIFPLIIQAIITTQKYCLSEGKGLLLLSELITINIALDKITCQLADWLVWWRLADVYYHNNLHASTSIKWAHFAKFAIANIQNWTAIFCRQSVCLTAAHFRCPQCVCDFCCDINVAR